MTSQTHATTNSPKTAVVTGASSGIGAATARWLSAAGWQVICVARRTDRIEALAAELGGRAISCDVSNAEQVAALASQIERVDLLVNNAGGAHGTETVETANFADWEAMFAANVVGAGRITQALLPAVRAAEGTIIFVTSTAAEAPYEGGAGYCGAKAAERSMVGALRLELSGEPIRVCEVAPGMVHTEEFSLTRLKGDQTKADAVYAGVPDPLVADDIADTIGWVATRPAHVNIDRLVVRPRAQAANHKVHRVTDSQL